MSAPLFVWTHRDAGGKPIGEIRRFVDSEGKKRDIPFYRPADGFGFGPGLPNEMKHGRR